MQSIPFHIAYLLIYHECVIVPGLGAFVVSPSDREKAKRWRILSPPANLLGFNSEIKHNDGLLANSIVKEKKCSYKDANLLIEEYVVDALHSLDEKKVLYLPWIGNLYLKDGKLLFQPERTLSCNAFNYGLADFSLPFVKDIQRQENVVSGKKNKEVVWIPVSRKFITYAGSATAALIAMCINPTLLNNGRSDVTHAQYASLLYISPQDTIHGKTNTFPETKIQIPPVKPAGMLQKIPVLASEAVNVNPAKVNTFHYYIVIASLPDQVSAKKALMGFQSEGFENAAILSTDGKHRIYANRLEDQAEAEKFLIQFRKDHPTNANAWLLKQKD